MSEVPFACHGVVIAIGDEPQLASLLALAVPLVRRTQGTVTPLFVGPDERRPDWLVVPEDIRPWVSEPVIVADENVGRAILAYVRHTQPDLLMVQWKGHQSSGRYFLGPTLDPIIQFCPCHLAVLRLPESSHTFAQRMSDMRGILVPSGGGPNASLAVGLAKELGDIPVTLLRVANPNLGPAAISVQWEILKSVMEPFGDNSNLTPHVVRSTNVVEGILKEADAGHDLIMIGATRESLVDRLIFGNLPQHLALRTRLPLLIIQRYDPGAITTLRQARWRVLQALPQLSLTERTTVYREIRRNARSDRDYYVMMILATALASLGLLLSSSAVIIGAMLVAPMMSALLGVALGIVQGDGFLLRLSTRTILLGVLVALAVSSVIGLLVPDHVATAEMLNRGSPNLLDLAVALVSGAVAAYASARTDAAAALPGVAIAVALAPPLATLGLAAMSDERQLALGAALLFATNLIAIIASAATVFMWMGFRPNAAAEKDRARTFRGGLLGTVALLLSVTLVLGWLSVDSIRRSVTHARLAEAVTVGAQAIDPTIQIVDWQAPEITRQEVEVEITAEVLSSVSPEQAAQLEAHLSERLGRRVRLTMVLRPVERIVANE